MRALRRTSMLAAFTLVTSLLAPASAEAGPTQPYVTITSPVDGSFLAGQQEIDVTASFNPLGTDRPEEIALFIDGEQATDAISCPDPGNATCTVALVLDTTDAPTGTYSLKAVVGTVLSNFVVSPAVLVAIGDPAASVAAPAPPLGAAPTDTLFLLPTATFFQTATFWSRSAGSAASLQLIADGSPASDPAPCPALVVGRNVCSVSLQWGSAATTGTHTLLARLTTDAGTTDSATRTMKVVAPSVTIDSPASGTIVSGIVPVTVTGHVTEHGEIAKSVSLLVDGKFNNLSTCTDPAAVSCTGTFQWNARLLAGSHTLKAVLTTTVGSVAGAVISVTIRTGSNVVFDAPTVKRGQLATVTGHVASLYAQPIAGAEVAVTLQPTTGASRVVHEISDGQGLFRISLRATTNTRLSAVVTEAPTFFAGGGTGELHVEPIVQCSAPSKVARSVASTVKCDIPGLPKDSTVQLQLSSHHHWYARTTVRSTGSHTTLPFRWDTRRTLWLRVSVKASKALTKGVSRIFSVRVN